MTEAIFIDINCDVGEGIGIEKQLLAMVSSCNIACGGHAGDTKTMLDVAKLAHDNSVKVGAHPSYPDRENFGRISMKIKNSILIDSIQNQLNIFSSLLKAENIKLNHIKPHGALYNDISKDANLAKVFLQSIITYKDTTQLYVPYGSTIAIEAKKEKFNIVEEAFADRNYTKDLSLITRQHPKAVLKDPKLVLNHLIGMIRENHILTLDAKKVFIKAKTFCVHGDTISALEILNYLSEELPKLNIYIKK